MQKRILHKILLIIMMSSISSSLFAQQSAYEKEWFVGAKGDMGVFWGDLKFNPFWPAPKMQELQAGGSIFWGKEINRRFRIISELNYTRLKGKKIANSDTLAFQLQGLSLALKGQIKLLPLRNKKATKAALYFESGAGLLAWKSLGYNQTTEDTISNLGWTNNSKKINVFIPAGLTFEYRIRPNLRAHFAMSYQLVFSDLLDGQIVGGKDSYSTTALGISYHFGHQKEIPKLLPYPLINLKKDSSSIDQNPQKELVQQTETVSNLNPFDIQFIVPEESNHSEFTLELRINKLGIKANGFFKVIVPSGFLPEPTSNADVSFIKLGYDYEYDFSFPVKQDSNFIPIKINLSEIEKGNYPIMIEGEIKDFKGNSYPIKLIKYINIVSEEEWFQTHSIQKQPYTISDKKNNENQVVDETVEHTDKAPKSQNDSQKVDAAYRIQILASKKAQTNINAFKTLHKINTDVEEVIAEGWYRYNVYSTADRSEAEQLCKKVRSDFNIPQAFIVYYANGKRMISAPLKSPNSTQKPLEKVNTKATASNVVAKSQTKSIPSDSKLIYRIEIGMSYDQPLPLEILQNKVGQEVISEFKQGLYYYYTIGELKDLPIAQAYLSYVKTQLSMGNAKIVQYVNGKRVKVLF